MNTRRVIKVSDAWHWFAEVEQLLLNTRALLARGYEVSVACQPESPLWERAAQSGARMVALPGMRRRGPLAMSANVQRLARLIDAEKPLVVHAYRSPPHALAAAARVLARHKPALVRSRGAAQRLKRHPLNAWLYRSADAVIASSQVVASDLQSFGVRSERLHIVRGAVDVDRVRGGDAEAFFTRRGWIKERPTLGMLARIDLVKGHRFVVRALALLKTQGLDCQLLCAGEAWGDNDARLQELIERHDLSTRVRLLGRIDDVADFLAACDVMVIASTGSETVSRAALEIMAAGRPLVATRVGVIPELVEGGCAELVEPADAQALAKVLRGLLLDKGRAHAMARRGRDRVEASYSIEKLGAQLEELYEGLVDVHGAPSPT